MKRSSSQKNPPRARPVVLVAIAGGSGSGKTWLAAALQRQLGRSAGLLSLDDFYRDLSHLPLARRARTNFDSPAAIDWLTFARALRAIARGETPVLPCYDFAHHTRATRTRRWQRRPIVLVEGLWPWVKPEVRALYALRIYRSAQSDLRYQRRLARDVRHRGRTPDDVARQWQAQVEPMHVRHVAPQRKSAHLVLDAVLTPRDLARLAQHLRTLRHNATRTLSHNK